MENEPIGGKLFTVVLIVALVITAFVTVVPDYKDVPDEVTIPVVLDLSGEDMYDCTEILKGIEIALDDVNGKAKVHFSIKVYDTGGDMDTLGKCMEEISSKGYPMIIGPSTSNEVHYVAENYPDIIVLSPSATADALSEHKEVFRITNSDYYLANGCVKVMDVNGLSKLAVICTPGSLYSASILNDFNKIVERQGGIEVVGIEFTSKEQAIAEMKNYDPDCVFIATQTMDGVADLYKEAIGCGINAKWFGTDVALNPATASVMEGLMVVTSTASVTDQAYIEEYEKRFGEMSWSASIYGYDCLMIASEVIVSCGYTADDIKDGLSRISYLGMTGAVKFKPNGDSCRAFDMLEVKDGKWTIRPWSEVIGI